MTQNRIKIIVDCFNDGDAACDEQSELTALEDQIDIDMRSEYITLVVAKVTELELLKDIQKTPFPGEDAQYAISCLLYTSDAADDMQCVDLGGRRIIKKKKRA